MKASELMVGDLVNLGYRDLTLKVIGLDSRKKTILVEVQDNFKLQISYNEEEIKPIPLTEEILEANGFSVENGLLLDNMTFVIGDKCVWWSKELGVAITKYPNEDNAYTPYVCIPSCVYVHELQHALRLCGLNELADSLKIQ